MRSKTLAMAAASFLSAASFGEIVQSGELDITQKNDFWDCTRHSCLVCRETKTATVGMAGGDLVAPAITGVFDSWIFTSMESNGCNVDSFPVGYLLFLR